MMCDVTVTNSSTPQDYVSEAEPVVGGGHYSLHFLLAQSYLTTGETDKATDHFFMAADGLSKCSHASLCSDLHSSVAFMTVC